MYFQPFVYMQSTTIFRPWMFANTSRINRPLPGGVGGLKSVIFTVYRIGVNIIHSSFAHIK